MVCQSRLYISRDTRPNAQEKLRRHIPPFSCISIDATIRQERDESLANRLTRVLAENDRWARLWLEEKIFNIDFERFQNTLDYHSPKLKKPGSFSSLNRGESTGTLQLGHDGACVNHIE